MSARPDRPPRLDDNELVTALESSQRLGMLGPAPIADVIGHSEAFLGPLTGVSGTVVDLGSGGGVPGLVVAWMRPDLHLVLVDRRASRTDHLRRMVRRLSLHDRVDVVTVEAAALPRRLPGPVDAVIARGFGAPQHVAAAARPLLRPSGLLVVSEPPSGGLDRWSRVDDLERLFWPDGRVAVLRKFHGKPCNHKQ